VLEHLIRLQTKYIDSKNDISEQDLRNQYDNMMIAIADIVTAGGVTGRTS
jgi:hypothetical protein